MTDEELFLKYNYTETKDMCLHFLTLITAVLVFSLNFSEKFFDFQHSTPKKRFIAIISWCLFIFSIILCGLGLVLNSIAGGQAVAVLRIDELHQEHLYYEAARLSYKFIIGAGGLFILGLIFTMVAAIISRDKKKAAAIA